MKARDLKSIVNTVSPALTGATLPICSCIHFSHDRIWATNLEATIEVHCDIAGVVASIPSKPLKALLSAIDPSETIELRSAEGTLSLRTTTGVTVLTGLEVEDVPNTKITEPVVASAKLESEFVDCLYAVAVAASGDQSRQVLTGVFLEIAEGKICLTATDSYRLHHDEVPASTQGVVEVISPYRYAKALPGKEPIALEVTENKIRFTEGPIAVTMSVIEGSFPKYRQLRPVSTTRKAVVGMAPESLQRTLKACERLADKMGTPCPLVLEFSHGTRRAGVIVKLSDAGEHRCELSLDSYSGASLRIGFNPSFLREAFSFAGTGMAMTDELKPVVITGREQDSYALLMPVRLS
jgi:DNA polymerase III subunit beta